MLEEKKSNFYFCLMNIFAHAYAKELKTLLRFLLLVLTKARIFTFMASTLVKSRFNGTNSMKTLFVSFLKGSATQRRHSYYHTVIRN